jgi:RNA polymerase sigma-70 factor, ECF subfamily
MPDSLGGEALLDRYFKPVYAYVAYRVTPDGEAARDITQEVFLAACRSTETLRSEGSALEWLRAIARAKVADHFRSAARRDRTLAPPEVLAELAAGDPGDEARERQARAARVSAVMRSLDDEYAAALEEKYLEGLSVRDMAARRGQSEKAVESMLSRARGAFRAAWRRIHGGALPEGIEDEGANP